MKSGFQTKFTAWVKERPELNTILEEVLHNPDEALRIVDTVKQVMIG